MTNPGVHILLRIKGICYVQLPCGLRHQLHQPHCALAGNGIGIEVRFHLDDGPHQVGIDIMSRSRLVDGGVDLLRRERLSANKVRERRAFSGSLAEVMVDLRRSRARCPDVGGRNRFPAMLRGTPECQRTTLGWSFRALARGYRKRFVDIDFAAIVVSTRDDSGSTGFCLHVWHSERKEGRDYGTSHQGELQAFSHSRVQISTQDGQGTICVKKLDADEKLRATYPEPDGES